MSDVPPRRRMGRPVRKSGEPSTKDRVIDAAIGLLSEQGYERTSMKQIAQAVDLTESALYRHFRGKEEILTEIIAYTERMVSQPLPAIGEDAARATSVFRRLFEAPVVAFAENPDALRICRLFFAEAPYNEQMRGYLKRAMEEEADIYVGRILEEQIEKGRLLRCETKTVAHLINVIRYQWCYQVSILDRGEVYDAEKFKRDLDPVIEFFEGLYSSAGAELPRPRT